MRISQLAERSGIPATTLRFYEGAGLLTADRTPSGYRTYGDDAVQRLAFIGAAKHLGLPLQEIAGLLAVWQSGACTEVKADLRPRIAARLAEAEQRAAEIAALTSSLRSALEHLDALPDRATPCDPECGFLSHPAPSAAVRGTAVTALSWDRKAAGREAERWRSAPVACSLTGEDMTGRITQWQSALDGAARREIPGGLQLTVPAERMTALAGLAAAEQQCCQFFDFRFHLDGPVLHLEVRAPAEAASLLAGMFATA
ncbi:MAG TPA: MerR family transcriptional regulator [Streptosporangiaceae bacterium]|nr:MerR family transcriptional regulator [Streptosporangiaceae bacterium]